MLSDAIVPSFLRGVQDTALICWCQFHGFQLPWYFTHLLNSHLWKIESWAVRITDFNQFSVSEIMSGSVVFLMQRRNVRQEFPLRTVFPNLPGLPEPPAFSRKNSMMTPGVTTYKSLKLSVTKYSFGLSSRILLWASYGRSKIFIYGMQSRDWNPQIMSSLSNGSVQRRGLFLVVGAPFCHFSGPRGQLFLICTKHPTCQQW